MERKNKNQKPIYYNNADEMNKPMSILIEELRCEIDRTRGKLHDIKMSYGWSDRIEVYEGGLTCMISAMYNFAEDLRKLEERQEKLKQHEATN